MNYISVLAVPVMICGIIIFGLIRKVGVYDCFLEGAKEGLESTVRIIIPLVGLLSAISMFRASGAMELIVSAIRPVTDFLGVPGDVVPLAFLRPVSGSGSIALVSDIFKNSGTDSVSGLISSVMMGSTETTFYILAVYFGSVNIKKIRHTMKSALLADFTGMAMAIILVRIFFS